jgi:hypothetical protein
MAKGWDKVHEGLTREALEIQAMMVQKERAARPYRSEETGQGAVAQSPVQAARARAAEALEDCYRTAHNLRSRLASVLSEEIADAAGTASSPVSGSCELRHSFDSLASQAGAVHEVLADILRRLEV